MGLLYIFYIEDVLLIIMVGSQVIFYLFFFNYFMECFSVLLLNIVKIILKCEGGINLNIYGIFFELICVQKLNGFDKYDGCLYDVEL